MDARNQNEETPFGGNDRFNEEIRLQGNSFVNSGKDFASKELDILSEAVHDASQRLHERNDYFAPYTDGISDKLHSASRYLSEESTDNVMSSVDNFAHRHPGLTIGGLLVAGFAATRWLKIGSHE